MAMTGVPDNEAIRELRDETKKLRIETARSSKAIFVLTIFIIMLTIVLVFQGFLKK